MRVHGGTGNEEAGVLSDWRSAGPSGTQKKKAANTKKLKKALSRKKLSLP
jgi:hypothetical protein